MAIVQQILNGQVVKTEEKETTVKDNNPYDKDMFLQLLVAEMQYQDPLEPTTNTEYVSELASFTQIEAVQAVQSQMNTIEANSLVGKYVIMVDDSQETGYASGKVDYVAMQDGEMYVSVNDKLYKLSDLDSVVDETYFTAVITSESFTDMVKSIPSINQISLEDEDKIVAARTLLDSMDSYTKGFVSSDTVNSLAQAEKKLSELKGLSAGGEE